MVGENRRRKAGSLKPDSLRWLQDTNLFHTAEVRDENSRRRKYKNDYQSYGKLGIITCGLQLLNKALNKVYAKFRTFLTCFFCNHI